MAETPLRKGDDPERESWRKYTPAGREGGRGVLRGAGVCDRQVGPEGKLQQ